MFRALTRTAVTAALLWGHVAAEPHCATASDLVTPFDLRPSVVGVAGASEPSDWLLSRESLDSAPHDHSSSFAFPPLLQIPPQQPVAVVTEPVAAPSLENQVPPAATAASDSSVAGVILDAEVADLPHTDDDAIDVQQSKFALAPSFAELQALSGSSP
ncbi:MAG: hypothetical protein KF861_24315, partial [Planctomycetaceae bacterium]|nr:hypothetical protein [Planctomycetaceae bacterium]